MEKVFKMQQGQPFLGGRATANAARNEALSVLRGTPQATVVFDFASVSGASHSFADELLAPLSDELGSEFSKRVVFRDCNFEVADTFVLVCDMHDLYRPAFDPEWPEAGESLEVM